MKIKRIFLVGIILLSIIAIGTVSAAENSTELAINDLTDDAIIEESVAADTQDVLSESPQLNIEIPEKAKWGERINVNASVNLPSENLDASIYVYDSYWASEDDDGYVTEISLWDDNSTSAQLKLRGYGEHNLQFNFTTNDGEYKTATVFKTVNVEGYVIYVMPDEGPYYWDSPAWIYLSIPSCLKEDVKITVNGKGVYYNYYDKYDDYRMDDYIRINPEDLVYGINNLTIEYPGDDNGNDAATFYDTIYCNSRINMPDKFQYKGYENITLNLPQDASGKLLVTIDFTNQTQVEMKDGTATFTMPVLDIGYHYIEVEYVNDTKYSVDPTSNGCTITPKVITPYIIGVEGEYISIEMPEKYNATAYAYIRDYDADGEYVAINLTCANITNGKGDLFLKLNESTWIYTKVVCNESEFESEVYVRVTKEDRNWTMDITPLEVINTKDQTVIFIQNPVEEDESQFILKIDGELTDCEVSGNRVNIDASNLTIGTHSFELAFLGDGYFEPVTKAGTFDVDIIAVEIRKTDYMYSPDSIYVYVSKEKANLTVKVNGKTIFKENIDPEELYEDYVEVPVDEYKYGINTVTINYKGSKGNVEKTYSVNGTYELSADEVVKYGGAKVYIYTPYGVSDGISVKIDGIDHKVSVKKSDYDYYKTVTTSKDLTVGNHTILISYRGDAKYPARTVEATLNVIPTIEFNGGTLKKGDGVSLTMPEDAKGNLTVHIRRNTESSFHEYANVNAAGQVLVTFDDLAYGNYYFRINYTGSDYPVKRDYDEEDGGFTINPEIGYPTQITVGENASVSVNLPGEKGMISIWGDCSDANGELVDGKLTLPITGLELGNNSVVMLLETNPDDEGCYRESYYEFATITVCNPITAKDAKPLYSANEKYTVTLKDANGNPIKSGKVTFYIMDGSKQILKKTVAVKNGAATLSYKITQGVKTYTIKTVYNKAKVSKKLTVKHVLTLKSATVKKSAKKLVLTATLAKVNGKILKSKAVTFKFNGKTYKTKTNTKGVAKVTINSNVLSKLKAGKKVTYQATYLKDTVKKTATIKK